MEKTKRTLMLLKAAGVAVVCALVLSLLPRNKHTSASPRDFEEIRAEGTLRAATEYNAVSYYVDGDTIAGFHYSLINAFAASLGLKAEITPVMSFDERMKGLDEGRFDLIAYSTVVTGPMRDSLLLSDPIILNKLVLVQRRPQSDSDTTYISNQMQLGGRTVHIVKGSPEALRLHNLESEIGDTIYIEEIEKYGPEQLIYMVSHGDIDYTVCDATVAHSEARTLDNIDIRTDVGFTQFYSWAADKSSPALMDTLNAFLRNYTKTAEYRALYNKYYKK
jgi:membrane-bound lytic murein transglycosylase MltF